MSAGETLRRWLGEVRLGPGDRLPPERVLAAELGLARADLRKALAALEDEKLIRRHVGRGTFMAGESLASGAAIGPDLSPSDFARTRLFLESHLAEQAALHATASAIAKIRDAAAEASASRSRGVFELADDRFHGLIAAAAGSPALLAIHDRLRDDGSRIAFGRLVLWSETPSPEDPANLDHKVIADRIALRDLKGAAGAARDHVLREYPFLEPG